MPRRSTSRMTRRGGTDRRPTLRDVERATAPALFFDSTGLLPSVTIARHGEVYAVEQLPRRAGGFRLFADLRAALKDGFTFARNEHA